MDSHVLQGQVAVVTGGSRGIGREVARALAQAGAKVAVTARDADKLAETVALIKDAGGECAVFVMDMAGSYEAIEQTVAQIEDSLGAITLLVNNAGIGGGGQLPWEADVDAWWQIQEVNVKGVFMVSKAVLERMVQRRAGRIINMGSYAGIHANPMTSAYAVSKAALMRLTDSTAEAAKEFGISVFVISPGLVLTDMTRDVPAFQDIPASQWTSPERSAELCVALATGKADKLTGRFIHATDDDLDDMIARADEIIAAESHTLSLIR
ncbi:MAG: SDR family oxidoreductase [Aggregatilineales bacterium]